MPINVPNNLPAIQELKNENIFIMEEAQAIHQDIRPLRIALLNLMPLKIVTETDLIRNLSNTSLQLELDLFYMDEHESKNTPREHLKGFYKTFDQIKHRRYDGLIITGAPVELLDFEEVDYWNTLCDVLEWSKTNVTNTLHICWGAQAGLYYHYGIKKYPLSKKAFGIFYHNITDPKVPLVRGFDDVFPAPHSRHTENRIEDLKNHPDLFLLAYSEKVGSNIVISRDGRQIFISGHLEYNPLTLKQEYDRDVKKGLDIDIPENYYPNNDPSLPPVTLWRAHANLLFTNWLNYYVYQATPYDWK
ncbi:MAG: homoserine O-succinyltransferase [Bacteroidales bacterium]|nr:homoserine O-succinyltransferase [Bacteroidales bacterium]MCB8998662.1 homoserine O-succinyltransferase [Bacteroidales bacterium]MCB9012470.1 homoserine O-succinyltransferase [Bacteroidales bacterium]